MDKLEVVSEQVQECKKVFPMVGTGADKATNNCHSSPLTFRCLRSLNESNMIIMIQKAIDNRHATVISTHVSLEFPITSWNFGIFICTFHGLFLMSEEMLFQWI